MFDLQKLVERSHEIEPLSASTTRLSALVSDASADLREIVRIVELDPALAGRVLRLANSAAMGAGRTIGTVRDAVLRVGSGAVLTLAVAGSARKTLHAAVPALGLSGELQWRHSVVTALAAEVLRGLSRHSVPPEAFTAALLHDIGKLVMGAFLTREDLEAIDAAERDGGLTHLEAETQLLGVNHAELGGLVAQNWHLPDSVVRGITYHHTPDQGGDFICDVVALANYIAKSSGLAPMPPEPHPDDVRGAWARAGIAEDKLEEIVTRVGQRFLEVQALYA